MNALKALQYCCNGDYQGYLIESLTEKLILARQDHTVFSEITEEEIEALKANLYKREENAKPF